MFFENILTVKILRAWIDGGSPKKRARPGGRSGGVDAHAPPGVAESAPTPPGGVCVKPE